MSKSGLSIAATAFTPGPININTNLSKSGSAPFSGSPGYSDNPEDQPWKGKPPSFFLMKKLKKTEIKQYDPYNPDNFVMSDEQRRFIQKYYPEKEQSPYQLMKQLNKQSLHYNRGSPREPNLKWSPHLVATLSPSSQGLRG